MHRMLQAIDDLPLNIGISGKGNASLPAALEEMIAAGACAMKLHEDWGHNTRAHRQLPVGRRCP